MEHIMKKTLVSFAAVTLMSAAGFASAAQPVQLTETQMDNVAAGTKIVLTSTAGGSAGAVLGYAGSSSKTKMNVLGQTMQSSSSNKAKGFLVGASSNAGSQIKIIF